MTKSNSKPIEQPQGGEAPTANEGLAAAAEALTNAAIGPVAGAVVTSLVKDPGAVHDAEVAARAAAYKLIGKKVTVSKLPNGTLVEDF